MAAYAASLHSSTDPSRAIYTRQLIAVPLLALPQGWMNVALDLASDNPTVAAKRVGWGPPCEQERDLGRQGRAHVYQQMLLLLLVVAFVSVV